MTLKESVVAAAVYNASAHEGRQERPLHLENPDEYREWAVGLGWGHIAATEADWLEAWNRAFEEWSQS